MVGEGALKRALIALSSNCRALFLSRLRAQQLEKCFKSGFSESFCGAGLVKRNHGSVQKRSSAPPTPLVSHQIRPQHRRVLRHKLPFANARYAGIVSLYLEPIYPAQRLNKCLNRHMCLDKVV
jgi:hypothetical protein